MEAEKKAAADAKAKADAEKAAKAAAKAAEKAASDVTYQPRPMGATFQVVADLESIQRPLYTGDTNFTASSRDYTG